MTRILSFYFILAACTIAISFNGYAQSFATFAGKTKVTTLPYETPNEFPSLAEFESEDQFKQAGLIPLSTEEITRFIDPNFDEQLEDYFLVIKVKLNSLVGIVFYHQLNDTDTDVPFYDYVLIIYNETGKQLSRQDFIAYEWIQNLEENSDSDEDAELFREMAEDYQEMELETFNDIEISDSLSMEVAEEFEEPNTVDEGYAISTIYSEGGKIYIKRRSISYFSGELPEVTTYVLNGLTVVFEEIIDTNEK